MRSSFSLLITLCASLALPVGALAADDAAPITGDTELGGALYKKQCRQCHGPTAKGMASYPKLRGKEVDYIVDKLERYRKGERFGPNTPLMAPRAKKLSDEDILNLATFIVSLDAS